MNKEKQGLLLKLLASSRYKIDTKKGIVYYYHKSKDIWKPKIPAATKEGYIQYHLTYNKKRIGIYAQNLFYIAANGEYPEGKIIDHRNNIKSDNKITNLRCITHKENVRKRTVRIPVAKGCKRIMGNKLKQIFELHKQGFNHSHIARTLNIHRLSVGYHIKKYENKEQFRYLQPHQNFIVRLNRICTATK